MGLFDVFNEDYNSGLRLGRRLKSDPNFAKQYYNNQMAQQMSPLADFIYGHQSSPGEYSSPAGDTKFGAMDLNVANPMQTQPEPLVAPKDATGLFDESVPVDQRHQLMNKRMLSSGIPGFLDQWAKNQAAMQNSDMSNLSSMQQKMMDINNPSTSGLKEYSMYKQQGGTMPWFDYKKALNKAASGGGVEAPISVTDLSKVMKPDGSPFPFGTTPSQARSQGAVLRNKLSSDAAGRKAMLEAGKQAFPIIEDIIYNDDGSINMDVIREAFAISVDPTPGELLTKWWTSDGAQKVAQGLEMGMQAITRTETGAAMPPAEVANTRRRFQPGPIDSEAEIKQKWEAYKFFISNAINMIDPTVRAGNDPEALAREVKRVADAALAKFYKPKNNSSSQIINYEDLP